MASPKPSSASSLPQEQVPPPTLAVRRAQAGRVLRPLASLLPHSRTNSSGILTMTSAASSSNHSTPAAAPAAALTPAAPIPRVTQESSGAPASSRPSLEFDPRFIHDVDEPRTNPLISPLITADGEWPAGGYFASIRADANGAQSPAPQLDDANHHHDHHLNAAQRWRLRRRRAAEAATQAKQQQHMERDRALVASNPHHDFSLGLGLATPEPGPSTPAREAHGHSHGFFASALAFWRSRDVDGDSRHAAPKAASSHQNRPRALTVMEPASSSRPSISPRTVTDAALVSRHSRDEAENDSASTDQPVTVISTKPAPLVLDSLASTSQSASALFPTVLPPPPRRHRHTRSDGSVLSIAPAAPAPTDASLAMSFVEAVALPQSPADLEPSAESPLERCRRTLDEDDSRDSHDRSGRSSRRSTISNPSDRSSPASRFGFSRIDEDLTRSPSPQALKKLPVEGEVRASSSGLPTRPSLPHRLSAFDDALHLSSHTPQPADTTPPTPASRSCAMTELQAILQQQEQHQVDQQQLHASPDLADSGSPPFLAFARRESSNSRSPPQHSENIPVPAGNKRPHELAESLAPTPQSSDPYERSESHGTAPTTSSTDRLEAPAGTSESALGQPSPRFGAQKPFPTGPLHVDVTASTKALISELDLESLFGTGGPANRREAERRLDVAAAPQTSAWTGGFALTTSKAVVASPVIAQEETLAAEARHSSSSGSDDEGQLDPTAPDHALTFRQASLQQEHVLGSTERLAEVCSSRRSTGTFRQSVTSDTAPRLPARPQQQRSSSSGGLGEKWDVIRGRRPHVVAQPRPIKSGEKEAQGKEKGSGLKRRASVAVDSGGTAIRGSRRGSAKDKHDSWWLEGGPLDGSARATDTVMEHAPALDARELNIRTSKSPSPGVGEEAQSHHSHGRHSVAAALQRFRFERRRSSRTPSGGVAEERGTSTPPAPHQTQGQGPAEIDSWRHKQGHSKSATPTATPEGGRSASSSRRPSLAQSIVRRPADLVRRATTHGAGSGTSTPGSATSSQHHQPQQQGQSGGTGLGEHKVAAGGSVRSRLGNALHVHVRRRSSAEGAKISERNLEASSLAGAGSTSSAAVAAAGGGAEGKMLTSGTLGMATLVEGEASRPSHAERCFSPTANHSAGGSAAGGSWYVTQAQLPGAVPSTTMNTTVAAGNGGAGAPSARRRFSGFRRGSSTSRKGSRDEGMGTGE